jgi:hypothetical protein
LLVQRHRRRGAHQRASVGSQSLRGQCSRRPSGDKLHRQR